MDLQDSLNSYYNAGQFASVSESTSIEEFKPAGTVSLQQQALMLGVPCIQLGIPLALRQSIVQDPERCSDFVRAIANVYNNVVLPNWSRTGGDLKVELELAQRVRTGIFDDRYICELIDEYIASDLHSWGV